ncbi:dynein heavy chain 2, axonemal-like [Pogonomyrmex barbatus]|uniref:Dynein heavy chain 2, axonemal-like n=1 Tax=Pogonomyrmex barbatus TaxID=144034 RepID=A0A6I9XJ20_9HYME|nr:dynein heavy chain 2, axonemal-like [Pogonomyrmex barbatus]
MQRRRNKVKDKPPPDPHREYLDAEFSDEAPSKIYEKNIKRTHFTVSTFPIFRSFPGSASSSAYSIFDTFGYVVFNFSVSYDFVAQRSLIPPLNPPKMLQNRSCNEQCEEEEVDIRPVYEPDELNELIQCVKDMTTLSGLTDDDWTWKCDMDIREFFHEPSIPVLCIYHVNGSLTTEFSFPTVPVHELTYFVRQPNEILHPENFHERILFGSMNDRIESHILSVIQNVFAPIFFAIETWPDSILRYWSRLCYRISVKLSN